MGFAIAKNKIKTGIIVGVIAVLLYLLVYFVADSMGYGNYAVVIAGVISIGTSLLSYWNSAKIALASNGAKKATGNDEAYIRSVVSGICTEAGLPMPELYVIAPTDCFRVIRPELTKPTTITVVAEEL